MKSIHCDCVDAVERVDLIYSHARTYARTHAILLGIGELAVIQVSGSGS